MTFEELKAMNIYELLDVAGDHLNPDRAKCEDAVLKRLPTWNGELLGATVMQKYTLRSILIRNERAGREASEALKVARTS